MEEKKDWKDRLRDLHKEINGDELFGSCASHNEGLDCCTEKKWLLDFIGQEIEKAKREAQIEILTEIFQNCYQEDSKTLELVEEKLSKLKTK